MEQISSFDLNDETLDLLFEAISERLTKGFQRKTSPHLAILVGQPGSGKSTIAGNIAKDFGPQNPPLIIDMDELRLYHPFEKNIFAAHPFLYDDITGRAAGKWNARLVNLAREKFMKQHLRKKYLLKK